MRRLLLLLLPLAWIYDGIMRVRNALFDAGLLPSRRFGLPVIAIGNLAVGGTGKTPHAEYVLRLLATRCKPAVLSRGYGRRSKGFVKAEANSTADELGDEPFQMWQKFPAVTVAVDADRCEGISRLLTEKDAPDVIVLDDAFQHRYVRAGLYVLLTDYHRLYTSDYVLPAGRLRESRRGARRADVILVTKCPANLSPEACDNVRKRLSPLAGQQVLFTTFSYGAPYPLWPQEVADYWAWKDREVLVITGIANPEPLHRQVEAGGRVIPLTFPDHHAFSPADIARLNAAFASLPKGSIALTTEKDASRLRLVGDKLSPDLRAALLVQPVEVAFLNHEDIAFNKTIIEYVTENQTNG